MKLYLTQASFQSVLGKGFWNTAELEMIIYWYVCKSGFGILFRKYENKLDSKRLFAWIAI